jgi:hypothetical protein
MEEKQEKICSRCKELRLLTNFPIRKHGSRDGHDGICCVCREERRALNIKRASDPIWLSSEKYCYRCNTAKPLKAFSRAYDAEDGSFTFCYECQKNKVRGRLPSSIIDNPDGTRVCTRCNIAKPLLTAFRKASSSKLGREGQCWDCVHQGIKTRIIKRGILRVDGTKRCPDCDKEKHVKEFNKNRTSIDGRNSCCAECSRIREFLWRQEHPEEQRERSKKNGQKQRSTVQGKLKGYLRDYANRSLKGKQKAGSGVGDLGCSTEFFQEYIESLWQPGMEWSNWSRFGWHVDHIKPLDSFDLTVREQFLEACHYTNMRPLWWNDNISKGAKSTEEFTRPLSDGPAIPPSLKYLQIEDPLPLTNLS